MAFLHSIRNEAEQSVRPNVLPFSSLPLSDNQQSTIERPIVKPSKKRLLFIPASIRSHIIPTLYLADLLGGKYDIHYAVTNQILSDIVSENGHTPFMTDSFRIGVVWSKVSFRLTEENGFLVGITFRMYQ